MNKEDKITKEDLMAWLERPLTDDDLDLCAFIATSIENRFKYLELQQENKQLKEQINTYENPEDLTLMYMWCDEKAKDKMKELEEQLKQRDEVIEEVKKYIESSHLTRSTENTRIYDGINANRELLEILTKYKGGNN